MNKEKNPVDHKSIWKKQKENINNKIFKIKNEFSKESGRLSNCYVEYDTPTGIAYVGLAKKPLMKNKGKFGFNGVKIQSDNRELIQCSECGCWFTALHTHIIKKHGMTPLEYKIKFGLNRTDNLFSDCHSNRMASTLENTKKMYPEKFKSKGVNNLNRGSELGSKKNMAFKNKKGTCPEQLKFSLINYINRFRRIPSGKGGRDVFDKYMTVERRFGDFNGALKEYGLPTRHKRGGVTEYVFPSGEMYSINARGTSGTYEELYAMMMSECKILKKYNQKTAEDNKIKI